MRKPEPHIITPGRFFCRPVLGFLMCLLVLPASGQIDLGALVKSNEKSVQSAVQKETSAATKAISGAEKSAKAAVQKEVAGAKKAVAGAEKSAKAAVQKEVAGAEKAVAGAEKSLESSTALAASMAHDSIVRILQTDGSMVIDEKTALLVGALTMPDPPTDILTNSILQVPAGPDPVQLDYAVEKGDSVHITLHVGKWKALHSVDVIQGQQVLFHRGKTGHKDTAAISVAIPADGTVSLRLFNRNFRKATVGVLTGLQPRKKNLVAALKRDTVFVDRHQTAVGLDTVGVAVIDAQYVITPRADITGRPYQIIPLIAPEDTLSQSPGWGYWIGLTKKSLSDYEALKPSMPGGRDPLEAFILGKWPALPASGNPELSWVIAGKDQIDKFKRSLPVTPSPTPLTSGTPPRLWNAITGQMAQWSHSPPYLMIRNASTLNEYTIYVKVTALTTREAMVGKDDKVPVISKSILLQYQ